MTHSQRKHAPKEPPATGRPIPGRLLALGSAAVVVVYGAGYFRTREAAARFADDAVSGSGVRRTPGGPGFAAASPAAPAFGAAPAGGPKSTKLAAATPNAMAQSAGGRKQATTATDTHAVAAAKVTPEPAASNGAPRAAPNYGFATTSAPAEEPAAPPTTVAAATAAPTAPAPAPQPAVKSAVKNPEPADTVTSLGLKDGTYTGWGTSRHGDIEATVIIEGGAIASAKISRCLTRYSCSWIAHLQNQVVARQSPEVDYVSGATQSTNAFYYAVVEALTKAKPQ